MYSAVISSVLALFQVVNFLGTTLLKAPPKMTGIYDIDLENESECLPQKMTLNLQQSGIYFFGQLNQDISNEEKTGKNSINFSGKLSQEELLMSGNTNCSNNQNKLVLAIKPQQQNQEINGYLKVNETPINFQGKLQQETNTPESKH